MGSEPRAYAAASRGTGRGRRLVRLGSAVAVAALVLTSTVGCGAGGGGHPARALTLTESDLPDGFSVAALGGDAVSQMAEQLHDSTKNVHITPSRCAAPGTVPASIDTARTGLMSATDATYSVSESVIALDDLEKPAATMFDRDRISGDCASVTVNVDAGPIKGARITVDQQVVPPTSIDGADQLLVVHSVSTTVNDDTRGDQSGETGVLVGRALVDDYLVTVQMSAIAGDRTHLDTGLFATVMAAAVDRVAAGR